MTGLKVWLTGVCVLVGLCGYVVMTNRPAAWLIWQLLLAASLLALVSLLVPPRWR